MKAIVRIPAADVMRAAVNTVTSDETADRVRRRNLLRWRAALELRWRQKLDEAIILARAYAEVATAEGFAGLGAPPYQRLQSRTERAYQDLADIEDAIVRLETGDYGICAGCGGSMPEDWLADQPEVRLCSSCASRRPAPQLIDSNGSARRTLPGGLVPAARAPGGPG